MTVPNAVSVSEAYSYCRRVAKREAKNFYYAFRVLPKHKSDAMCAVYAFMRKADDLADDESLSIEHRREYMARWNEAWRRSHVSDTDDPVFIALKDTQQRFGIRVELLEQLVAGTTLDLYGSQSGVETFSDGDTQVEIYKTFDDLYHYCYLVASVVGLVCIRIFGYTDVRAEQYAERVGIAFQLTNILRDVVEDAQRGRVYLPLEDLASSDISPEQLLESARARVASREILAVLEKEIARAESYYASVNDLIPLLDADSRVAMEVLATIYRELLQKIAGSPLSIFEQRVSVSTSRKLSILLKGLLRARFSQGRA